MNPLRRRKNRWKSSLRSRALQKVEKRSGRRSGKRVKSQIYDEKKLPTVGTPSAIPPSTDEQPSGRGECRKSSTEELKKSLSEGRYREHLEKTQILGGGWVGLLQCSRKRGKKGVPQSDIEPYRNVGQSSKNGKTSGKRAKPRCILQQGSEGERLCKERVDSGVDPPTKRRGPGEKYSRKRTMQSASRDLRKKKCLKKRIVS